MRYSNKKNNGTNRLHKVPERNVYSSFVDKIYIKPIETEKNKKTQSENKEYYKVKIEIMELIFDYVYNNKSIAELIEKLNSEEKYKKFGAYFEGWINDTFSKRQQMVKKIKREMQNGKNEEEIIKALSSVQQFRNHNKFFQSIIMSVYEENTGEKGIEHE